MTDSHETMRDRAFVARLLGELRVGRSFALVSILATRGSMPRAAGARMALLEDGSFLGTIGGGNIEYMGQEKARKVLAGEAGNTVEWITHAKTGMACGGDVLVSARHSLPGEEVSLERLSELLASAEPFVLVEHWGQPGDVRVEMLTLDEMGPIDPRATADTPLWDEGQKSYVEPVGPDPIAYIFGGGHVGCALVPVLESVGFRVVVFDDREGIAVPERFPKAERVILGDFRNIAERVNVTRRDYVLVMSHGHVADIDVLEQVYAVRPAYVGCIGSRGKAAFARKTLAERGVSREWLESVHLPVGDDILAVTPGEIAISIAGEMIRCRADLRPVKPHQHPVPTDATPGR